jgi:hypothetical protein
MLVQGAASAVVNALATPILGARSTQTARRTFRLVARNSLSAVVR